MADAGNEKPDPNRPSPGTPPEDEIHLEEPPEPDLYQVSEPEPDEPDLGIGVTTPQWYVGSVGGQKEGPLSLTELRQRITSGRLDAETLVWKSGMPDWVRAGIVPELFETPSGPPSPSRPPPLPSSPTPPVSPTAKAIDFLEQIDRVFSRPSVYRLTGLASAGLGGLTLLIALILLYFRSATWAAWFVGFVFFALIFLIGEAAGAILDALGRIESRSDAQGASHVEMPVLRPRQSRRD